MGTPMMKTAIKLLQRIITPQAQQLVNMNIRMMIKGGKHLKHIITAIIKFLPAFLHLQVNIHITMMAANQPFQHPIIHPVTYLHKQNPIITAAAYKHLILPPTIHQTAI